jgi:hypothetical protein
MLCHIKYAMLLKNELQEVPKGEIIGQGDTSPSQETSVFT